MAESEDPAELVARLEQALERIAARAQRGPAIHADADSAASAATFAPDAASPDLTDVTTRLDALIARLKTALSSHMQE